MSSFFSHSGSLDNEMKQRIAQVRWFHYKERMLFGTELMMVTFLASVTLISALENLFSFNVTERAIIVFFWGTASLACTMWSVGKPFLQWKNILPSISEKEFAEMVGKKIPLIKDRLKNLLEMFEEQEYGTTTGKFSAPRYSRELIDASFNDLRRAVQGLKFTDAVSFERVKKTARLLGGIVVISVFLFIIPQTGLSSALFRVVHYQTNFHPSAPFSFLISPGSKKIVKGESVSITILPVKNETNDAPFDRWESAPSPGKFPQKISLSLHTKGILQSETTILTANPSGKFEFVISSLKQSTDYFAEAGDVRSPTYSLTVVDRPVVRSLIVQLVPPRYSKLPSQNLDENIGDVNALRGTDIHWGIITTKKIRSASINIRESIASRENSLEPVRGSLPGNNSPVELGKEKLIPLQIHDSLLSASMILTHPAFYRIHIEDMDGIANADPIEYKLDVKPDETPTVEITDPGRNVDVTPSMELPLQLKLHDDFGFSSLRIAFRLVQSKYEKPQERYSYSVVPLPVPQSTDETVAYLWNISSMGLVPEDVIEYRAEVFDNDEVGGPQMGISQTYLLRLPSIQEVFADADKGQSDAIQNVDQSLNEANGLKKDLDELSRDLKTNQKFDWQKQKKAQDLAQRYQELQKKIEDVKNKVDTIAKELQKNNVLSPETLEKYSELQKMMQEMNSPEFQQALKRMQDAMQSVNPETLSQAMQQVQFSEEMFRKNIERTLSLLKRIQIEQKVDEMLKRAAQLQQQQDTLQKETAGTSPDEKQKAEELAQRQDEISKGLETLQQQLAELDTSMQEFSRDMPMNEMKKSEQAAADQQMEQSLQNSSRQLRAQQLRQSLQSQQKASEGMQNLAQRLSEMQEQLFTNENAETMNALRKATNNLLDLSQRQENLKNESRTFVDPNSQQFRNNAEEQLNIENDLSTVTNDLMDLSQKSFVVTPEMGKAIGQAINSMNQAMSKSDQRNGQMISAEQENAMASLNKAASLTQGAMQAMQQAGSGGGMGSLMAQLQRLSMQQRGINVQTEQLGQNQGLTPEQIQEIGRLASEQDAVRKSLEELNKEAQTAPERDRILGDLQKIADEMKEVATNISQNDINPNTIHQQERILSRLLDAQTSLRERDYEQRRVSTVGATPLRRSPAELQVNAQSNQLPQDILKALEEGYSKEYQDLIRRYYEALTKAQ